ncbi:helix-turn-helix transcriptional regulator [Homoserinibacter sp. GY 40078]|uniref:ArsR/SmtB family transcription factor n=1 Tax=Homoserinibacter sp. GY 40078 TaxID=2603275 RepID=UPI0011CC0556|nr:metalloregulator ArsR/SmtB family transcription factor [Homoserinibacter sp. GY 40078]TXK19555.1 winged helix-turn-helix transcriptional regulator [Homoserinibacter sp. GY 40078]
MSAPASEVVFEALGDPVRRVIVRLVAAGEQPAGAVVEGVQRLHPISQPSVSQHLKVLREAGVLSVRAEGTRRFYALDAAAIVAAREWLDALVADPLTSLANPLDALSTEIARGARERRNAVPTVTDEAPRPERRDTA